MIADMVAAVQTLTEDFGFDETQSKAFQDKYMERAKKIHKEFPT